MSKQFWRTMCGLLVFYRIAFYLSVAIFLIAVVSIFLIENGTATYYVTLLTIGINGFVALGSGYLIRKCVNHRAEQ